MRKTKIANSHTNIRVIEPLSKKEKETTQYASKTLLESQKALETETEAINYKKKNKKEARGTRRLIRSRRPKK